MGYIYGILCQRVSSPPKPRPRQLTKSVGEDTTTTPTLLSEDATGSSRSIYTSQDGELSPYERSKLIFFSPPTAEALLYGMLQLARRMRRQRQAVRWYRK